MMPINQWVGNQGLLLVSIVLLLGGLLAMFYFFRRLRRWKQEENAAAAADRVIDFIFLGGGIGGTGFGIVGILKCLDILQALV